MNTYTALLQLETGTLRAVHVMAPDPHHARRIITSWIGHQHTDAVALVSLTGPGISPVRGRRAAVPVPVPGVESALVTAAALFLFLLMILILR